VAGSSSSSYSSEESRKKTKVADLKELYKKSGKRTWYFTMLWTGLTNRFPFLRNNVNIVFVLANY
jgi:hypothetical protein